MKLLYIFSLYLAAVAGCADKNVNCAAWGKLGYCSTTNMYHAFMKSNCMKSCGFCGATATSCVDLQTSCATWKSQGTCVNPTYVQYMKINCPKACGHCTTSGAAPVAVPTARPTLKPTLKPTIPVAVPTRKPTLPVAVPTPKPTLPVAVPTPKPTLKPPTPVTTTTTTDPNCKDLNLNCGDWAIMGECTNNPGYMKINCRQACGFCGAATAPTDACVPLTAGRGFDTSVNIVFVPSKFTDLNAFETRVRQFVNSFRLFKPLDYVNVPQLNIAMVKKIAPQQSYCDYFCQGKSTIERLLCCTSGVALSLARECTRRNDVQIIVIHNDVRHGGAGGKIATSSLAPLADRIVIHEIGHSLFNLADEYNINPASTKPAKSFNCDQTATCTKWSDLLGTNGVNCVAGWCDGASSWTSETTIMNKLDAPMRFQEVNLRITCCVYKQRVNSYPPYCAQFASTRDTFCPKVIASNPVVGASVNIEDACEQTLTQANDGTWFVSKTVRLPDNIIDVDEVLGHPGPKCDPSVNGSDPICQRDQLGEVKVTVQSDFAPGSDPDVKTLTFPAAERFEIWSEVDPKTNASHGGWINVPQKEIKVVTDCRERASLAAKNCPSLESCALLEKPGCALARDENLCPACACVGEPLLLVSSAYGLSIDMFAVVSLVVCLFIAM